ncbi:FadR/GntR family transcriptional regulator [uncultured Jannaschia sp.]|uniref:FadR/GntR family transcriptional regulator n=1 Tax=uncultured Jannaschia sp. TaxID=293347 RepID=UPI002605F7AA|nr:FadR/GntR family transcriptional regulator [uncultured Jannaschia sp.]
MLEKTPVARAATRKLQDMIRSGELAPGSRIPSQRVLSERLGLSRPMLREALLTLETLGLVHTLPSRGTFVSDPASVPPAPGIWRFDAAYDLADVFAARLFLESELARHAAGASDTATHARLEDAVRQFEQSWDAGDLVTHVEADLAFHRTIAESCPNPMLRHFYRSVETVLTESQRQPIPNTARDRMRGSIDEHRAILAALRAGDASAAARAMRVHIRNTAKSAGIDLE